MIRSIMKAALPRGVVKLLADLGRLEPGARGTYLRMRRQRRRRAPAGPVEIPIAARVVMVCHGNILRSAYAEALFRDRATSAGRADLRVSSAGLHAESGRPADPRGVSVAREQGVDLSAHRATRLDESVASRADLLLVMDYRNAAELVARHPDAEPKVCLLGSFDADQVGDDAIADPYGGDIEDVRRSYQRVAVSISGLVSRLSGSR